MPCLVHLLLLTLLTSPCLLMAGDFSFDGTRTPDGSVNIGKFNSTSGGGGSGSGGASINPAEWSSPGQGWHGRALPPEPAPTVTENRTAHDRSMEARSQAYLADQNYQKGYAAAKEGRFADAEAAFVLAKEHHLKLKELGGAGQLEARLAQDDDAIAWAGAMKITATLGADLYANAKTAKVALEKLIASTNRADAKQSLLRADGGEAEALGREHLRAGRWGEARDAFVKAGGCYEQAHVNAKRLEVESQGRQRFPYNSTMAGTDIVRTRQSQATALNGMAIQLEAAGKLPDAHQAAKQAAALWPDQPALQENLKRLGAIPVGFEKPAQGTPVETKP